MLLCIFNSLREIRETNLKLKLISRFHRAKNALWNSYTNSMQFNINLIENRAFQNQNNKNFLCMIIIILILNINLYIWQYRKKEILMEKNYAFIYKKWKKKIHFYQQSRTKRRNRIETENRWFDRFFSALKIGISSHTRDNVWRCRFTSVSHEY